MSSSVVEVRDHSYFLRLLVITLWKLQVTPCLKNIVCKFLPDVLRGYMCSSRELLYRGKCKAVALPFNCLRMLFFCIYWIFFLKIVILALEYCILFSPNKNVPKGFECILSEFKGSYCVIIKNIFILLVKAALICERMPVTFFNEANNYWFTVVPVWFCSGWKYLARQCNLILTTDIAFLQH